MNELLLIKSENERLMEGEEVMAAAIDAHRMHIMEHKAVLADPDLRKDADLARNVLGHIQQHIDLLRNTDPDLLMLLGEQPLNPPGAPPNGPQGPQEPMGAPQGGPNSPMPEMMSPAQGQVAAGQTIQGPGVENVAMPGLPIPPAPFESNAVLAQEVIPS